MTQDNLSFNAVGGPSKFDLMLSLFDGNKDSRRTVEFKLEGAHAPIVERYLMEDALTLQVKEQLQSVSLPEVWADYMLKKVEVFEHEEIHASGNRLGQMKENLKTLEAKLDALVDLHLNHDIEREIYLMKKDALMCQRSSLQAKSSSARAERKNWVEPLRKWILDSKRAGFLATSKISTRCEIFCVPSERIPP